MGETLLRNFRNIVSGNEGFAHIAKHLNCEISSLRKFFLGNVGALTYDQQVKLASMVQDLYNGKNLPSGGFYEEEGIVKWTSKIQQQLEINKQLSKEEEGVK